MPYDFLNRSHSGSGLKAIVYDKDGNKVIGRGTNISWQDQFDILPVEEWAVDGIDEFVPGKMRGSGTIGTLFIAKVQDDLPKRSNFITAGPFAMQIEVAEGRPNAGTILAQFEEVWFNVVGGSFSATGLAAQNVNFVYGKRIPGEDIQGVSYPEE